MTTPDSALNVLSVSLTAADSPLAASPAEILTDGIQELIEAELTPIGGDDRIDRPSLRPGRGQETESSSAEKESS